MTEHKTIQELTTDAIKELANAVRTLQEQIQLMHKLEGLRWEQIEYRLTKLEKESEWVTKTL